MNALHAIKTMLARRDRALRIGFYERVGRFLGLVATRHRVATAVTCLVVLAAVTLGLGRVRFSTDYRIFFSKDDPGLAAFERLEHVFTKTDNVLFVLKTNEGATVFDDDALAAVKELTDEGWKVPYASRVDSLTNFPYVRSAGDDIHVAPLGDLDATSMRAAAMNEPLLVGSLLSKDGTTTGVNVTIRLPGKAPEEVTESAEAARAIASRVAARHPRLTIRPCGMAFMNNAFMQASVRDMGVMIPLMLVVMLLAMAILLRSAWATVAVATIMFFSAAASMAFAGWLRYPLTPPAVAAPMMVLTVAIADGVHIVLAAVSEMRKGTSKGDAIITALVTNLEAVTYTWLTTVVGFVCLNYSDAPPVRHLANMTCFGVTLAFVSSITLLPALIALFPMRIRAIEPAVTVKEATSMRWLGSFVTRHRRAVLAMSAVLTIGAGVLASRLETNDQFVQYFGESIEFRRDADFTMKNLSGIYRLEYQVGSGAPSGVSSPAYLERLDAFATWLRAQPEVEHVYGIVDLVKHVNQALHGDDRAAYRIPETREAVSEALFVYEMGLPSGLDLTDRLDVDRSAARMTVTVRDMTTREMNDFTARSKAWLESNTPKPMWTEATGPVVIFSQLSNRNAKSMVQGDFVSLALISLCMIIVLRSFKLGVLSVIPNVVPIVIGYGAWKLAVGQMNIVASVAGSISLGIIVDDTIHFLTKFQALHRKEKLSAEVAMQKTLAHVGPAMLSTSAILVAGFGVLTLSAFQMTSYLGWLSVLIVSVAPVCDLILVPALVVATSHVSSNRSRLVSRGDTSSPSTAAIVIDGTAGAS